MKPRLPLPTLAFPATPFPHLLRSNIAPSPLEFSSVSKTIFDAEALRASLSSQLIERKTSVNLVWKAKTRQKIQHLENFVAAHKGIVSVIRRVPLEIIQYIFQWLSAILRLEAQLEPKWALPFAYGQICSSWRSGALAVYSLWSLFPEISIPKSPVGKELQFKYMTELLHRSRQSPIQFSFDVGSRWRGPFPACDLLVQSSERWQVVHIHGYALAIRNHFYEVRGRIPNLESLIIGVAVFDASENTLGMFQTAPKLREVQVLGHNIGHIKLPNHQLVDLVCLASNTRNPLSQLINANNLENLIYESKYSDTAPITNTNKIYLPSLKQLYTRIFRLSILDFLTVPILENLRIEDPLNRLDKALLRSLTEMASRSGNLPHLQELHIWSLLDEMPEGLDEVLRSTPALRLLDMPIPSPHDILALASTNTRIGFPLVTSLEFCYFGLTKVLARETFSALKQFTNSRCELREQYVLPLRTLRLATECGRWWDSIIKSREDTEPNHVRVIRQSQLELWEASETSATLTVFKKQIFELVPGISTGNPLLSTQSFKIKWFKNIQNLLDEIENVKVDDAIDILISEIHLALECLITLKVPHDYKTNLDEKANGILAKWRPLLERSLSNVHWVFEDAASLKNMIYIPTYHDIRLSAHALGMIYGITPHENLDRSYFELYR